jgi:hypothetical protein
MPIAFHRGSLSVSYVSRSLQSNYPHHSLSKTRCDGQPGSGSGRTGIRRGCAIARCVRNHHFVTKSAKPLQFFYLRLHWFCKKFYSCTHYTRMLFFGRVRRSRSGSALINTSSFDNDTALGRESPLDFADTMISGCVAGVGSFSLLPICASWRVYELGFRPRIFPQVRKNLFGRFDLHYSSDLPINGLIQSARSRDFYFHQIRIHDRGK